MNESFFSVLSEITYGLPWMVFYRLNVAVRIGKKLRICTNLN